MKDEKNKVMRAMKKFTKNFQENFQENFMMKVTFGSLMLSLTAALGITSNALAYDEAGFQKAVPACSKVHLVKTVEEAKDYQAKCGKDALVALDVATPGFLKGMEATQSTAKIQTLLSSVADRYSADVKKRISYWQDVQNCFGSSDAKCKETVDKIKSAYGGYIGDLRMQLALSNDGMKMTGFDSQKVAYVPNKFPEAVASDLSPAEKANFSQLRASNPNIKDMKDSDLHKLARKAYEDTLSSGIVKNGLYLVAYLPKPSSTAADGTAAWSDAEWKSTIGTLINNAKAELKTTQETVDKGTVSFPAVRTSDFVFDWNKDKRDLMYYATLTPELNKYLHDNPDQCGAAKAALSWMDDKKMEKMVGTMAAFAVTGGGLGVASNAADYGMLARGLAGVAAMSGGYVGAAMTYSSIKEAKYTAENSFRQVAKIGVEKGKEADVIDPKTVVAAQDALNHIVMNTALMQGAFLVGGTAVGYTGKAAANKVAEFVTSKTPEAKAFVARLLMRSANPTEAMAQIEKSAPAALKASTHDVLMADPQLQLGAAISQDINKIAGVVKPSELEEVQTLAVEAEPRLEAQLKAEGQCHSSQECSAKAIAQEKKAFQDAEDVCMKPAK